MQLATMAFELTNAWRIEILSAKNTILPIEMAELKMKKIKNNNFQIKQVCNTTVKCIVVEQRKNQAIFIKARKNSDNLCHLAQHDQ